MFQKAVGATATTCYAALLRSMGTWYLDCIRSTNSTFQVPKISQVPCSAFAVPSLPLQTRYARAGDDVEAIQKYEDARIACEEPEIGGS